MHAPALEACGRKGGVLDDLPSYGTGVWNALPSILFIQSCEDEKCQGISFLQLPVLKNLPGYAGFVFCGAGDEAISFCFS